MIIGELMGDYENVTLGMVYRKLQVIEKTVEEINEELHEVKPEFIEKLEKIEKSKIHKFKNIEDMESHLNKM